MVGKRERLVAAACARFHRQGVEATTLAEIADEADVPLGNVYYYFKAKDDIVAAVIAARCGEIQSVGALLEQRHRSPKARLKALVHMVADQRAMISRYGCPYGTLCAELVSRDNEHARELASDLMHALLGWTEEQFRTMGRHDARDLAIELVTMYQGSAAVASALGDADLFARQARRMQRWIDSINT